MVKTSGRVTTVRWTRSKNRQGISRRDAKKPRASCGMTICPRSPPCSAEDTVSPCPRICFTAGHMSASLIHIFHTRMNIAKRQKKARAFARREYCHGGRRRRRAEKTPGAQCAAVRMNMWKSQPETADKICIVVAAGQVADNHAAAAGRGGVDVLPVADVDAGVGAGLSGVAAGIVEEHQIAGLQFGDAVHPGAQAALPLRRWR